MSRKDPDLKKVRGFFVRQVDPGCWEWKTDWSGRWEWQQFRSTVLLEDDVVVVGPSTLQQAVLFAIGWETLTSEIERLLRLSQKALRAPVNEMSMVRALIRRIRDAVDKPS